MTDDERIAALRDYYDRRHEHWINLQRHRETVAYVALGVQFTLLMKQIDDQLMPLMQWSFLAAIIFFHFFIMMQFARANLSRFLAGCASAISESLLEQRDNAAVGAFFARPTTKYDKTKTIAFYPWMIWAKHKIPEGELTRFEKFEGPLEISFDHQRNGQLSAWVDIYLFPKFACLIMVGASLLLAIQKHEIC